MTRAKCARWRAKF